MHAGVSQEIRRLDAGLWLTHAAAKHFRNGERRLEMNARSRFRTMESGSVLEGTAVVEKLAHDGVLEALPISQHIARGFNAAAAAINRVAVAEAGGSPLAA
jgi:hypothetical protein